MKVEWKGGALNPLISLFDREVRQVLRRWAASVPEDSLLRSQVFERAFDVFRGFLEKNVHLSGVADTLKEKLTDYGDYFTSALRGDGGKGQPERTVKTWMDQFFTEAGSRLEKQPNDEAARREFEKIKLELELRLQLLQLIEAEAEKLKPSKKEPKGGEPKTSLSQRMTDYNRKWREDLEVRKARRSL